MRNDEFQTWLAQTDRLTAEQRGRALAALNQGHEAAASLAAIELRVDQQRRCPRCQAHGGVARGHARGLRRYACKACGRTFNALTGTPLSGFHHKQVWLRFGEAQVQATSVRRSARHGGIAASTAFRWRRRFPQRAGQLAQRLQGLVEADETYLLHSCKGERQLERRRRRRGGKARKRGVSSEQVPVLLAVARGGATTGAVLQRTTAAALESALRPVLASDAVLVSDAGAA